jgi:hypothetical protein
MATVPKRQPDPLQSLRDALEMHVGPDSSLALSENRPVLAFHLDAALRSALKAALPGRQQKKNLEALMDIARKAFVRTLRRRAGTR